MDECRPADRFTLRMIGSVARLDQTALRIGALQDNDWGRMAEAVAKLGRAASTSKNRVH